uniref:Heterogeneous nuclear ribonucleoprotein L-like n=1 Tax=Petromyzon marinus TaxID=7757 RepID=A0AAJ7WJT1_PETMA|nr:heterogeneous nuclear ribonucleoprotein L-like [Petromyzon marinus]
MIPKTRQALVEFEDPESSRSCVDYSSKGSVYVCGQPAYFNFSTSQKLWRPGVPGDNGNSNHILLFTILNPIYPITTDVLYNICKPFGPLQRIVIFRKNGLQAFVEYPFNEMHNRNDMSAIHATRLNVFKNDSETWDFTNPGLKQGHQQPPPPGVDYGSGGDGMGGGGGMGMGVGMGNQVGPQGGTQGQHVQAMMNQQADNKVLIVYDLDAERFNCDRVFNILCLFGDVEKVKFLKSKPGAAMVEMGDQYAVHRAVFHLNMSQIFGNKINLCVSRQRSIVPGQAFELPDGTDSYRDYAGSHNHRYANSEKAAKNRNQRPTAVLHFFNAPTDITAEMFAQVRAPAAPSACCQQHRRGARSLCDEMSIAKPRSFKVFSGKTRRQMICNVCYEAMLKKPCEKFSPESNPCYSLAPKLTEAC